VKNGWLVLFGGEGFDLKVAYDAHDFEPARRRRLGTIRRFRLDIADTPAERVAALEHALNECAVDDDVARGRVGGRQSAAGEDGHVERVEEIRRDAVGARA
jgi:hypothetical protein